MPKYKSPRGTHDILPAEAGKWQWIKNEARTILGRYGYGEIQTPLFEDANLFLRGVGEVSDIAIKEMYVFNDKRGRDLALRPEGTASVVRAYIQHHMHTENEVQKLYYLGQMFRYDRPQAGRNRQFFQLGSEAIGSSSPLLDLETILLWDEFFRVLGLTNINLSINSVGCKECRPQYQEAIRTALSSVKESLCTDCQERYIRNPLRILDCKVADCREYREMIPTITEYLCSTCCDHHSVVRNNLQELGYEFTDDPYLVRGLDYYTRTAFEVIHGELGDQNSIGGGGRYDDLVETLDGGSVPAVGFSAGLERILLALEKEKVDWSARISPEGELDFFLVYTDDKTREEAFRRMLGLRRNFRVDMDYTGRSLKGQFRKANRLGVRKVLIFGSDELKKKCVVVRDMLKGEEEVVPLENIDTILQGKATRKKGGKRAGD
jgi:histidyl-tRNA synthetase